MKKLIYGIGINDADYKVTKKENGKHVWYCPFYQKWMNMLRRAYCPKYQQRYPTYINVTVCDDWLTFSSFKLWMQSQDWENKELDKDLLVKGNKVYSPETCAFISKKTNMFTNDNAKSRGSLMVGVYWCKLGGKFRAMCRNPFNKKKECLGYFADEMEAHLAWKKRKHEIALQLAEMQTDERASKALRVRYL